MDEHLARMSHAQNQPPSQHADDYFHELDLAMIECFEQFKLPGLTSVALYTPEPKSTVYVVPLQDVLGRISVVPFGDTGTIPYSMRHLSVAFGKICTIMIPPKHMGSASME